MKNVCAAAILLGLALAPATASAETHRFTPTQYYTTYSAGHPPALHVKPGDRVITKTIDASGHDDHDRQVSTGGPNPQIGPFYVDGAEPGDVLVVTLNRLEPNRATAHTGGLLNAYALDPTYLRSSPERQSRQETWTIDKAKGVARTTSADLKGGGIEVPLVPMLGCVADAPRGGEVFGATTPGRFGGNMDYPGMIAGVKLMLPVNVPGALLFLGDGHARQGGGELVGTGLETSLDVEFTVDLIKQKAIGWPRLETGEAIVVLGSARPLLEALQHANTEMLAWLMQDYGFDERGASLLMGEAADVEVANIVDPNYTVATKIPKRFLRTGASARSAR